MIEQSSFDKLILASRYLDMGQSERALLILDQADEEHVEEPFYWYLRGRALIIQEKFAKADLAVKKGLALAPDDLPLLVLYCNSRSFQHDLVGAETAILKALRQKPNDPQLLCIYAELVAEGGQLEKSERLISRAKSVDPEHRSILRAEMLLSYLRGKDKDSAASGRSLLSYDPEDAYSHYLLGHSLSGQGQIRKAEHFFANAARLDPTQNAIADSARTSRFLTHWLMIPLWPLIRLGRVKVWLAAVIILMLLNILDLGTLALIFAAFYITFVVYSWVVPPLLQRWLNRGYRRYK